MEKWVGGVTFHHMMKGLQVGIDGGSDKNGGSRTGGKGIVLKIFRR